MNGELVAVGSIKVSGMRHKKVLGIFSGRDVGVLLLWKTENALP